MTGQDKQDLLIYRRELFEYSAGRRVNPPDTPACLRRTVGYATACPAMPPPATPYGLCQSAQPVPPTPEALRQQADKAQEALDNAAAHQAVQDRINFERDLASATITLLDEVRNVTLGVSVAAVSESFARFRKELQPLARTYGVKITLVGDKTKATLVRL